MSTQTLLPSAVRTIAGSPYNSPDAGSGGHEYRGVEVYINVTANVGAFSLIVKLQAKDQLSGQYVDISGAATAAIVATGLTRLVLYPGTTAVANQVVAQPVPDVYRAVATITGAGTSATFSVSAELLP